MIQKKVYQLGVWIRNPSLESHFSALKVSEKWTLGQLRALQWRRLEETLVHAGRHVPFYRNLWREWGWEEKLNFTPEDFRRLPIVTKEDLIRRNSEFHADCSFERLQVCETSGTSGQVLTFKRNEEWDSFNRAAIFRGYSWHGVHPWEFNLYFWGYNLDPARRWKVRLMDFLLNRYRVFDYSEHALLALRRRVGRATYIEGYSSMIYELARLMEGKEVDTSRLKMVKGTSEKIFPHYQEVVRKVFGRPMASEYGAAEAGIIAFSCPTGNLHENTEGVFNEIDQDGALLVTNLHARSLAVIRYRLGDEVRLAAPEFKCSCGMAHPVIEEVTGRIGKVIVGRTRRFPSLTLYYVFKNLYFEDGISLNYQGRQCRAGVLELAVRENPEESVRQRVREECARYFSDELEITYVFGADLRSESGKLRDFITTLA